MDSDILQSNILDLNEQKMSQLYGDWVIDSQNLKTIANKDDLVDNIVKKALND